MTEIEKLLTQVRALVSPKGAKAKLATHLEVPQSRLSEWLNGKCNPSSDIALRLLKWAKEEEDKLKQKAPAAHERRRSR